MLELRERLKAERRKFLKPYFDLRRSLGAVAEIQRLADLIYLPNLRKVEDEVTAANQLSEIRAYLLTVRVAVQKFEQEKELTLEE